MVFEKVGERLKAIPANTRDNTKTLFDEGIADFLLKGNRRMKEANKELFRGGD